MKERKKIIWKPGTMIYPLPVVLVSCGRHPREINVLTVAWTGITCTEPPQCYVAIRPERYSHRLIVKHGDFCINLTTKKLARATDWCGVKSGRDTDKFGAMKLTPLPSSCIGAPLIAESPVNLECVVKKIIPLGSHDLFLAEIVAVHASAQYLDPESGAFDLARTEPICYCHGQYYSLGRSLGKFGFSVAKKKKRQRHGKK